MSIENKQDAAEPSSASAGSVHPLAWAVVCPTGEPLTIRWTWHECLDVAGPADEIIPLYRQQKPTLTDDERTDLVRMSSAIDAILARLG